MSITVMQEDGPVLVEFYLEPVEDRAAGFKTGHYVARDVEYVRITPPGGNLVVESEVTPDHQRRFQAVYDAWKKGIDPIEDGSPLREWPPASPAMVKTLAAIHVHTVEALAACPDGPLQGAGMGMVALREKAKAWLQASVDRGVIAEEISALKVRVEQLEERNRQLEEENRALAQPKRGPGRPRKDENRSDAA